MGTELPSVDVIVPYQATGSLRAANLHRLLGHWRSSFPRYDVQVGQIPADVPWCKADAISEALARTEGDILVIADADVWLDPEYVRRAVRLVNHRRAPWVVPHRMVHRLAAEPSAAWRPDTNGLLGPVERRPYIGVPGGGMFVVRREDYVEVPMDPRFRGWGGQDIAWAHAADTLIGKHRRLHGTLIHLHHEVQPTKADQPSRHANDALMRRYATARDRRAVMRRLVQEPVIT